MPETYSPFSQKDIAEVPIQVNEADGEGSRWSRPESPA